MFNHWLVRLLPVRPNGCQSVQTGGHRTDNGGCSTIGLYACYLSVRTGGHRTDNDGCSRIGDNGGAYAQQYIPFNCDYEIILDATSMIERCPEDAFTTAIPSMNYAVLGPDKNNAALSVK